MRIVTVATPGNLRPRTNLAIRKHWLEPHKWDIHWVSPGDPFAYGNIIATYWQEGESFAVVEPDIVIRADVAEAFLTCPEPYCAFPYPWLTNVGPALGCTRFTDAFLARYPDAMRDAQRENITWKQLDVVLMRHILVKKHREQPHVHLPPVEHLNEGKRLVPGANPEPLIELPDW